METSLEAAFRKPIQSKLHKKQKQRVLELTMGWQTSISYILQKKGPAHKISWSSSTSIQGPFHPMLVNAFEKNPPPPKRCTELEIIDELDTIQVHTR
ncbi:hypothetical protein QE152_g4507 [Popillia japonica]|uniref:Uncharacterized protein n=1 Tax=Popillia japonica TaxID=7064 RepID=A0AAW1N184_POPJA